MKSSRLGLDSYEAALVQQIIQDVYANASFWSGVVGNGFASEDHETLKDVLGRLQNFSDYEDANYNRHISEVKDQPFTLMDVSQFKKAVEKGVFTKDNCKATAMLNGEWFEDMEIDLDECPASVPWDATHVAVIYVSRPAP